MAEQSTSKVSKVKSSPIDVINDLNGWVYLFDNYRVDDVQLMKGDQQVKLTGQQLKILRVLAQHAFQNPLDSLDTETLRMAIWADEARSPNLLSTVVGQLRGVLGPDYIPLKSYRLRAHVQRIPAVFPSAAKLPVPNICPWPGSHPYDEARAGDFFGREEECEKLANLILAGGSRVVLFYSPSGAGKSSLINAALRRRLETTCKLLGPGRVVRLPGDRPIPRGNPYTIAAVESLDREYVPTQQQISWETFLSPKVRHGEIALLVLDQFEEIVTTSYGEGHQRSFFIELGAALAKHPSLRILLAFREEYLAQVLRLTVHLGGDSVCQRFDMGMLKSTSAQNAIIEPLKSRGIKFENNMLVNRLTDQLSRKTRLGDHGQLIEESGESIEPRHLSLTCAALWNTLADGQNVIQWQDFDRASRSAGVSKAPDIAVARLVEDVLIQECDGAISAVARNSNTHPELIVLGCLQFIAEGEIRIQVREGRKWTGDLPNEIANELESHHLLRIEERNDARWFELAHDTLIRPLRDSAGRVSEDSLWAIFEGELRSAALKLGLNDGDGLLQECCLTFVASDGTIQRVSQREIDDGRLPTDLVSELVIRQILRQGSQGHLSFYELLHPRIAQAIQRRRPVASDQLLHLRRLLASELDQCKESSQPEYSDRDALLLSAKDLIEFANFSKAEVSLLLRSCLTTGLGLDEYIPEFGRLMPAETLAIIRDSMQFHSPAVRRHATEALLLLPLDGRADLLLDRASNDLEISVRKAATDTLARLPDSSYLDRIFQELQDPRSSSKAATVLACIYDVAPAAIAGEIERQRRQLDWAQRIKLRMTLSTERLRNTRFRILLVWAVALASTIVLTVPPRAVLGAFSMTVTQVATNGGGFFEAGFHGVVGAILWSTFIGLAILFWWFIAEGRRPWTGRNSALIGAIGGFAGGVVNTIALLTVYGATSLAKMGWISSSSGSMPEAVSQAFLGTGLGFAMPIYGAAVGFGSAEIARRILPWWWLRVHSWTKNLPRFRHILTAVILRTAAQSWILLMSLVIAALITAELLVEMPLHPQHLNVRSLIGETISLYFGGFGLVIGLFMGLFVLRTGIRAIDEY